jgi:hypothetical protein
MKSKNRYNILLMQDIKVIIGVQNFGNNKRHGVFEDTEFARDFRL